MSSRQFVDGVLDVVVLGGVARIDFFELFPEAEAGKKSDRPSLRREKSLTVALPVEGFVRALAVLDKVRDQITSGGGQGGAPESGAKSPNFKMEN